MEDFLNLLESDDDEIVDNLFRLANSVRPREDNYKKWKEQEFIQRIKNGRFLNLLESDDDEIVDNLFRLANSVRLREDNYKKWKEQEFIQR
ncbi:hypothetical protein FQA39_LY18607 [Lamprigera yunnana]|nr:hypothetical protein FQA39_LY18607 [Lamprigera yunnana]